MKDDQFRPRAYEKAARLIESMERDLADIYKADGIKGLKSIPGIGESTAEKIEEYIKTGGVKTFEKLKKEAPVDLESFEAIEGIGPKMIKALYENLGVRNLKDLEKAAKAKKIRGLPHFGEKTEENILRSIELSRGDRGRFLLGYILPIVRAIEKEIGRLKSVKKVITCGSVRRMKETVGDIDILAIAKDSLEVMEFFTSMPMVEKIIAKGDTKSSVRLDIGIDADLRVVREKSFGAAKQYFTGNKDHNIELRKIAIKKGWKLNEYGLFDKKSRLIAGRDEKEIYKKLGLDWMPPEMRENQGEIELALKHKLPRIVKSDEVLGDLHLHTAYSDGAHTIREMAETAKKQGLKYIAVTDHIGSLVIAGAMDKKTIEKQWKEVDRINKGLRGFRILKSCEVDINSDGTIALDEKYLKGFDMVVAAVHSNFKMNRNDMTKRIVRAVKNPYVNVIAHPTGRIIHQRAGYEIDFGEICKMAARHKTALEINCYPNRLDLNDLNAYQAIKRGVKLSIGTDSHSKTQLHNLELGVAQARRAWAKKSDILNCMEAEELIKFLNLKKK